MKVIKQHILAILGLLGIVSPAFVSYAMFNRVGSGGVFGRRIYAIMADTLGWKAYLVIGYDLDETIGVARGVIDCDHPRIVTYPDDELICLGRASVALNPPTSTHTPKIAH